MSTPIPAGSLRSLTTAGGITVQDRDRTRSFLLLHGGGGVLTMAGFADLLAERTRSRVLLPTHPGFGGTPRRDAIRDVRDLAAAYVGMLEEFDLTDVTVIGNSFGGWLAAEIALQHSPRVTGAVIVDGIGIEVEDHPLTDVSGLSIPELQALSWHDPSKAPTPTPTPTPTPVSGTATAGAPADPREVTGPSPDVRALIGYTGPTMSDPTLLTRLAGIDIPVHVIWGESDRIAGPEYGKA